jgi:hypothetical protein
VPPVCFAAGLETALRQDRRQRGIGVAANLAVLIFHGILMVAAIGEWLA